MPPDLVAIGICASAATIILLAFRPRREPPTMSQEWLERQQRDEERAADRNRDAG